MLVLYNTLIWKLRGCVIALPRRWHSPFGTLGRGCLLEGSACLHPRRTVFPSSAGQSIQSPGNQQPQAGRLRDENARQAERGKYTVKAVYTGAGKSSHPVLLWTPFSLPYHAWLEKQTPKHWFFKEVAFHNRFLWDYLNRIVFFILVFGMTLLLDLMV